MSSEPGAREDADRGPLAAILRLLLFATGCLAALVVTAVAALAVVFWVIHPLPFDPTRWKDTEAADESALYWEPRSRMVDDLMASGKLDGLTEAEVLELLGPAHEPGWPLGAVDCDLHYLLGAELGGIDDRWLFLTFDEDVRVERYWIYTD